ncbi:monooxygenase [Haladaptatus paucihalophilus DX253]|uniref:Lysine N6-hydroxylase n=1 Tax=Haladaptatus paucihalophilus DX253 TaxID=797209 RepID=E7QXC4_HALPU|nr:lysine N(6)-hydroxylase/L-ornithine N(5)-oxygenase family protein [Haladaptatus paucihalophilus]EFW90927.1 monooxygenase [Haladaptatus paucihalophilus DX253]SHK26343.1 lysine N6-hydroxylase [Haladaptatus paucihalophilus DX253]
MTDDERSTDSYDVVGIGLGPFNLGLAALLEETESDALFLERKPEFEWHGGMLIEDATLEVPFLADLVTLADPTSEYTYLNYLRETDRLYEFYFYETFQVPRREYDDYCRWVAETLGNTAFSRTVTDVRYDEDRKEFHVTARDPESGGTCGTFEYRAENVVVGVGSVPKIPEALQGHPSEDVFHTASYLDRRERCLDAGAITVVGSGQSAAEVFLDLLKRQPEASYRLDWLTRSEGFFPMEYSKLGLQHFTPEYTEYFYDLPQERKDDLVPEQGLLYKGIDPETSEEIYDLLYERSIGDADPDVGMLATTEVEDIEATDGGYRLTCEQWQEGERFAHESDVVVLGTGYHRPRPPFLAGIEDRIARDAKGRLRIAENYEIEFDGAARLFVQNADLYSHGVGTPDLGLGCQRNAVIIESLLGEERYPTDEDTVFQDFSVERFCSKSPGSERLDDERATPTQED